MVRHCHSSWGLRGGDSTVREVLSSASVTCLLGVELGVEEFAVVKGVGDVLAGRVEELFAVVKGVGDVLAGRGAGF